MGNTLDRTEVIKKADKKLHEVCEDSKGGCILRVEGIDPVAPYVYEFCAGVTQENGTVQVTPHDWFEVASVTKLFTAVMVMKLVEQGLVGLDDMLALHLPPTVVPPHSCVVNGAECAQTVTIRQILNHTAGFPHYWEDKNVDGEWDDMWKETNCFLTKFLADPQHLWTPEEILSYAPLLKQPKHAPGTKFHYSDTGYVVLGLLIQQKMGLPLPDAYRRVLFDPLNMNDTYLVYREPSRCRGNLLHRYDDTGDLFGNQRQSADWAGGGLVSTAPDLAKFMKAFAQNQFFPSNPYLFQEMHQWVDASKIAEGVQYGLGLFNIPFEDEELGKLVGHDGHTSSFMYYWPEKRVIFTGTLSNAEREWYPLLSKVAAYLKAAS
jgi:D-alanyl-D-alanine carboxypeptidase